MKRLSRFFLLGLSLLFVFSIICANASYTSTLANDKKMPVIDTPPNPPPDTPSDSSSDELSPLDTVIQDLEGVFDFIDSGDKKNAIKVLKSAQKMIRKIEEFASDKKNEFSDKIKQEIKLIKSNKNDEALNLIDALLNDLSNAPTDNLSPLEQVTQDLGDASDLIDNDDSKTALTTLKNVLSEISKVDELTSDEKKSISATINNIIQLIKSGDIDQSLSLIDQILSDLSDASSSG